MRLIRDTGRARGPTESMFFLNHVVAFVLCTCVILLALSVVTFPSHVTGAACLPIKIVQRCATQEPWCMYISVKGL